MAFDRLWEPLPGASLNVDYWKINKTNVIGTLDATTIFGEFDRYAPTNIVRGPVDPNFPNLPGAIETVLLTEENLGNLRTSGVDVGAGWRAPATSFGRFDFRLDGTYVLTWDE